MSAAGLVLVLALALPARAPQAERAREAPGSEGALNNDVTVPVSAEAAARLAEGDQALERARAVTGPEAQRSLELAFDRWRAALVVGGPGASTWFDGGPEPRLSEGVHAGVVRRLASLSRAERARWSERHGPEAESALAALRAEAPPDTRGQRLVEVLRLFPLTRAAARAALELGDLALEAGLLAQARGAHARAELEAELTDVPELLVAARARARAVAAAAPSEATFELATGAVPADVFAWGERGSGSRGRAAEGEHGVRPGAAFLGATHVVVQAPREVLVLELAPSGALELAVRIAPGDHLEGFAAGALEAPREPPGWPLLPLADELGVVLVVGRSEFGEPNALIALELELPSNAGLGLELAAPRPGAHLAWALIGSERRTPSASEELPALAELGELEFQPGPVSCGDRIVVQARVLSSRTTSVLIALDRRDGRLAWTRTLAAGADRVVTPRFARGAKRVAAQPLLAFELAGEPRLFAGTHLGLGALLDGLKGEPLWSLKNRRRGEREPGWSGDRPVLAGAAREPLVLWAPMDSDRLYTLRPHALAGPATGELPVLARAPEALDGAERLLGGDGEEHLALARVGRARTLSARRAGRDRVDALDLGPEERFSGTGLLSATRAWVASDRGLYLFDRTRELYLLDYEPLAPAGGGPLGGDLVARDAHVLVVGAGALWSFRAIR